LGLLNRFVPEGEVLFEVDSIGYEFFIILKGKVSIFIKLQLPDYEAKRKAVIESPDVPFRPKPQERTKSNFEGVPKSPPNPNSTVLRKPDAYYVLHRTLLLKEVNRLGEGFSFGEAALLGGKSALRNATIFCAEDCYFAAMDKGNYDRIIGEHQTKEMNDKIAFIKKIAIFSPFDEMTLKTTVYFFEIKTFSYRQVIFKQGVPVNHIYLIRKGRIKVEYVGLRARGVQKHPEVQNRKPGLEEADERLISDPRQAGAERKLPLIASWGSWRPTIPSARSTWS
jgi:CRP-like cAMP-binding protein